MRLALLALVAACHSGTPTPAPVPPSPSPSPSPSSSREPFGFYLLAMMRPANSCSLALHGLWPNYTDAQSTGRPRAWPQYCGAYAHCEKAEDESCAPGVAVPAELSPLAPEYVHGTLATHEWSKHGSCTLLAPGAYFDAELAATKLVHHDALHGGEYAPADLQRAFGIPAESVVLGCNARCELVQVGFCLAKDAGDHPTGPTPCTKNVTTSDYDNGCVTKACARIAVPCGS